MVLAERMAATRRQTLLGLAAWSGASLAQPRVARLRVATHALPPYVIAQRNAPPVGALRDFMDTDLAPRLQLQFEWLPVMSAARVERSLRDGSAELAPLLTLSAAGVRDLQFVHQPVLFMDSVLALRPRHPLLALGALQASHLAGLRVGTALGLVLPPDFDGVPVRWDVVAATDADRAILTRVAREQLDAGYFSNPDSPRWTARHLALELHLRPLQVARRALYPAFAPQVGSELVARYGTLAAQRFASEAWLGTLQRWMDQAHPDAAPPA